MRLTFNKLNHKRKCFFQLKSLKDCDIIYYGEKNFANNPCHSGSFFRIRSSHLNLNRLILLPANRKHYGNHFFGVNGVVTKLNARMAQSILRNFERRLG